MPIFYNNLTTDKQHFSAEEAEGQGVNHTPHESKMNRKQQHLKLKLPINKF